MTLFQLLVKLCRRLSFVGGWALLPAFFPPSLPAAAEMPAQPGEVIAADAAGDAWRELFTTLAGKGAIVSRFTERRWFSVRKEPVTLRGEMRLSTTGSLSLTYEENGGRTVIIDSQGVLLRDARGRSRAVPAGAQAAGAVAVLMPVLRFDLANLEERFEVRGAREGEAWRLDFTPRTEDLLRALGRVTVGGAGEVVGRIELRRGEKQRVEITIEETRTGVTFTAEEQKKFFR